MNCSYQCAYDCAQLRYTTQHRTVLIIFPLILQTIIKALMLSNGGEGVTGSSTFSFITKYSRPMEASVSMCSATLTYTTTETESSEHKLQLHAMCRAAIPNC